MDFNGEIEVVTAARHAADMGVTLPEGGFVARLKGRRGIGAWSRTEEKARLGLEIMLRAVEERARLRRRHRVN